MKPIVRLTVTPPRAELIYTLDLVLSSTPKLFDIYERFWYG